MYFWHSRNIRANRRPGSETRGRNHRDEIDVILHHNILIADSCCAIDGWRIRREYEAIRLADQIGLEQTLDAGEVLQDKLVASVKFYSWLPINTVCSQLCAEFTLWLRSIAS